MSEETENNPEGYPWNDEQFKGNKHHWAYWWLEFHYLHHAMNAGDIETEMFCREMMKTKKLLDQEAAIPHSKSETRALSEVERAELMEIKHRLKGAGCLYEDDSYWLISILERLPTPQGGRG